MTLPSRQLELLWTWHKCRSGPSKRWAGLPGSPAERFDTTSRSACFTPCGWQATAIGNAVQKGQEMSIEEVFAGVDQSQYESEVRQRWGDDSWERSAKRRDQMTDEGRRADDQRSLDVTAALRAAADRRLTRHRMHFRRCSRLTTGGSPSTGMAAPPTEMPTPGSRSSTSRTHVSPPPTEAKRTPKSSEP